MVQGKLHLLRKLNDGWSAGPPLTPQSPRNTIRMMGLHAAHGKMSSEERMSVCIR